MIVAERLQKVRVIGDATELPAILRGWARLQVEAGDDVLRFTIFHPRWSFTKTLRIFFFKPIASCMLQLTRWSAFRRGRVTARFHLRMAGPQAYTIPLVETS